MEKFFIEYKIVLPLEKEIGITFHQCSRRVLKLKIKKIKANCIMHCYMRCMLKLTLNLSKRIFHQHKIHFSSTQNSISKIIRGHGLMVDRSNRMNGYAEIEWNAEIVKTWEAKIQPDIPMEIKTMRYVQGQSQRLQ